MATCLISVQIRALGENPWSCYCQQCLLLGPKGQHLPYEVWRLETFISSLDTHHADPPVLSRKSDMTGGSWSYIKDN
ncbi:hypothetical protein VTN96DRAFT_2657 [Rasamsonia emersonii]